MQVREVVRNRFRGLVAAAVLLVFGCSQQEESASIGADVIFVGDNIITMDDSEVFSSAWSRIRSDFLSSYEANDFVGAAPG